jgi:hypothetical protein
MTRCWSCQAEIDESSRYCSHCGSGVSDPNTPTTTAHRPSPSVPLAPSLSTETPFVPGAVLAGRFRIIGRIGKGGMGELYRADDLKLGQAVALKFLPKALVDRPGRMERFLAEVRIARQISHPNVCRVYEIFEADGQHFLSMEYIDGEDLASLTRRIGRLPGDKAVELAHEMCLGLHAAHASGILHRDLKPENVMLDARGRARITDFGLASMISEAADSDARSGTPAYMSPEQLNGVEVTVRSDVYALGLVLFELFTGKRPFKGHSLGEYQQAHTHEIPPQPSALAPEIDAAVERVILWCLEKDPARRPSSALAVAAALPGGDPLTVALAAGETPAPEVVAAAGADSGLAPRKAWTLLGLTLASLALVPFLARDTTVVGMAPIDRSADELAYRAREIVAGLGVDVPVAARAAGIVIDGEYLQYIAREDRTAGRWRRLTDGRGSAFIFWYRQSPRPMVATDPSGRVRLGSPPNNISGMASVQLDRKGRLIRFELVPPQVEGPGASAPPNWGLLFREAGIDPALLKQVSPRWTSPHFSDARAAWEGRLGDDIADAIRVEAAAYQGRVTYFQVVWPWTRPRRMELFQLTRAQRIVQVGGGVLSLGLIVASVLWARRNWLLGRGDRRGALRLAYSMLSLVMLRWVLHADHVWDFGGEVQLLFLALGSALLAATLSGILYLAVEPYVRRRWASAIISWTRLISGQWRNPLVGYHLLAGVAAGAVASAVTFAVPQAPLLWGSPAPVPYTANAELLLGMRHGFAELAGFVIDSLLTGMAILVLFIIVKGLVRSRALATIVVLALLVAQLTVFSGVNALVGGALYSLVLLLPLLMLLRLGLWSFVASYFVLSWTSELPFAAGAGQGWVAWFGYSVVVVVALAGFRLALGKRPILGRGVFGD